MQAQGVVSCPGPSHGWFEGPWLCTYRPETPEHAAVCCGLRFGGSLASLMICTARTHPKPTSSTPSPSCISLTISCRCMQLAASRGLFAAFFTTHPPWWHTASAMQPCYEDCIYD